MKRLPDKWGYDYRRPRLMSPYMKRSLGVALLLFLPFVGLLVLVEAFAR